MKFTIKKLASSALISAAAVLAAPAAHADLITFEGVSNVVSPTLAAGDTIYMGNQSFRDSGFLMTVRDSAWSQANGFNGQAGILLNGSDPSSCNQNFACPSGNLSNFFGGENDGSIEIMRDAAAGFSVRSLRFAFLSPLGGLADGVYGQLQLTGLLSDGSTVRVARDFPGQDQSGNFAFDTWLLAPEFSQLTLSSLSINACMFDGQGNCFNDAVNMPGFLAQFAVDDLDVSVPLPGTAPLMLLGMAGLAYVRRRRAQ